MNSYGDRYTERNVAQTVSERDRFTVERYRQFANFLPRGAVDILDVGCNTGRGGTSLKAVRGELSLFGVDCVHERLLECPDDTFSAVSLCLAHALPFPDDSFDVVLAGELIEHLYPSDVDRTISEFFRVLAVGGRLLLTTPNPADIKRRVRRQTILGGAHLTQHHIRSLKQRLRMTGFRNVRVYGSGKTSRYLGTRRVGLLLFGSYLATGDKY